MDPPDSLHELNQNHDVPTACIVAAPWGIRGKEEEQGEEGRRDVAGRGAQDLRGELHVPQEALGLAMQVRTWQPRGEEEEEEWRGEESRGKQEKGLWIMDMLAFVRPEVVVVQLFNSIFNFASSDTFCT